MSGIGDFGPDRLTWVFLIGVDDSCREVKLLELKLSVLQNKGLSFEREKNRRLSGRARKSENDIGNTEQKRYNRKVWACFENVQVGAVDGPHSELQTDLQVHSLISRHV